MALSTRRRSMGLRPRRFGGGNNLTRIRHCSSVPSLGYCTLVSIATAPSLECQNSRGRSFFYRFRQFQNAFLIFHTPLQTPHAADRLAVGPMVLRLVHERLPNNECGLEVIIAD